MAAAAMPGRASGFGVFNDAAVAQYGYTREEFARLTLVDLRPADDRLLFLAAARQEHQVRHVHHLVQEVEYLALGGEDGRVGGAPVPLLETTALGLGALDVVSLNGQAVRRPSGQRTLERGAHVVYALGARVARVVGKLLEDAVPEEVLAAGQRGTQVGIAHRHDGEVRVRCQEEVGTRTLLEEVLEVRRRGRRHGDF